MKELSTNIVNCKLNQRKYPASSVTSLSKPYITVTLKTKTSSVNVHNQEPADDNNKQSVNQCTDGNGNPSTVLKYYRELG